MKIPFLPQRRRDYAIEKLAAADVATAAEIHREDFTRAWSEDEFDGLMAQDGVFGFAARETGHGGKRPVGFVLARIVADEGEILTVAVARDHRREGIGWKLLDAVLRELHGQRAAALFLEVDETNTPALALYRRLGFLEVGRRPAYYQATGKPATGALVMRRDLR
jgi:ribosomal-protein-alanine N-acetyltransferase